MPSDRIRPRFLRHNRKGLSRGASPLVAPRSVLAGDPSFVSSLASPGGFVRLVSRVIRSDISVPQHRIVCADGVE
jgi:hypothetical protein